jgi:hypothetical protein
MSVFDQERTLNSVAAEYTPQHRRRRRRRARSGQKPTFGEPARMSGSDGKAQFSEGLDPASALWPTEHGPTECSPRNHLQIGGGGCGGGGWSFSY